MISSLPTVLLFCLLAQGADPQEPNPGDRLIVTEPSKLVVDGTHSIDLRAGELLLVISKAGPNFQVIAPMHETVGQISASTTLPAEQAPNIFCQRVMANFSDFQSFQNRALMWRSTSQLHLAMADYAMALRIKPDANSVLADRALDNLVTGNYKGAISDCSELLERDPQDVIALRLRGSAYITLIQPGPALKDLDLAIKLAPDQSRLYVTRAYVHLCNQKFDLQRADLQKAVELDGSNYVSLSRLAKFYVTCPADELRNAQEGLRLAQKACEMTGWQLWDVVSVFAEAQAELGNFDKAQEYAQRAKDLAPPEVKTLPAHALELFRAHKPLRVPPIK